MQFRLSRVLFGLLAGLALLSLTACEFSASTANIASATTAKDEEATQPATVFDPADTFYLVVDLANAPDDTTVKAAWYAVDVGTVAPPNTLIDEASLTSGSAQLFFNLAPESQWAPGAYRVDLYLNDELERSIDLQVTGEVVSEAAEPATEPTAESTAEPAAEPAVSPTEAAATGAVTTQEGVRAATIRIEAQGSFVDPEFGEMTNAAGQGSGFIIDPSGIAVTNNHVVTGAAFLEVYLDGENEPRNARVLGVSECSDLAVIDIEGDGLPYLEWREGEIPVGTEVYVAGFPFFGNTEYTLTRGIVSKASADGETDWASVDSVLEIDAVINPGNSGGPLVDGDGRVVGINYAATSGTNQYFAISRDEARPLVEQLRAGQDVNSIGINGRAVTDGESISGIWVSSVESGSPADQAGLRAGDILTTLEGLVLATDGTMSAYCDILRSRNPEDTMTVEVLRLGTGEILEGQINGRTLEPVRTVDTGTGEDGADSTDGGEYTMISDDSGRLFVSVPVAWDDIEGSAWVIDDQEVGPALTAATDFDGFVNTWSTAGVFFGASESLAAQYGDALTYLDAFDFSDTCAYDGRTDYSDGLYTGAYDTWSNCGEGGSTFIVLTAQPEDAGILILIQAQLLSDADRAAFDEILSSFYVTTE